MNIFSNISKSKISRYFFLYTAFPLFWFYELHTPPTQSSLSGIVGSLHFLYQLLTLVDSFGLQTLCMFGYIYFIHFLAVLHVFLIYFIPLFRVLFINLVKFIFNYLPKNLGWSACSSAKRPKLVLLQLLNFQGES